MNAIFMVLFCGFTGVLFGNSVIFGQFIYYLNSECFVSYFLLFLSLDCNYLLAVVNIILN